MVSEINTISRISEFFTIQWYTFNFTGNWWNSKDCFAGSEKIEHGGNVSHSNNITATSNVTFHHTTPVEEYWE